MKMPHPGDMRHRITIGYTANTINENGYGVAVDNTVCTVWASIQDASGKWFYSGDADQAQRGIRFVIRWRNDVAQGYWIEYESNRYTITRIGEYDFQKRYMQLTAERVEGVK